MPTPVIMPALGLAQEHGRVLQWFKAQGESVKKGEPLMEIETDKATVEIEAPADGILSGVTAAAGDEVPVGGVVALILAPGESSPPRGVPAQTDTQRTAPPGRAAASPKARRLAAERGIDLATVSGSGPGGEILASDVLAAAGTAPALTSAARPIQREPAGTIWRLMAERTTQSWTTAPHFFLLRAVNAAPLVAWRERLQTSSGAEITATDLLVKAVALALREHPRLNGRWDGSALILNEEINVGVAVAVEGGLVVPVVHRADTLTLAEVAGQRRDLVARARAGRLRPEDLRDGTFTISNLGMFGVDAFQAVINPPQAAILAVGRIAPRVVAVEDRPAIRPTMMLSLSCDHRAVDGAGGARFLDALVTLLEEHLERLGET